METTSRPNTIAMKPERGEIGENIKMAPLQKQPVHQLPHPSDKETPEKSHHSAHNPKKTLPHPPLLKHLLDTLSGYFTPKNHLKAGHGNTDLGPTDSMLGSSASWLPSPPLTPVKTPLSTKDSSSAHSAAKPAANYDTSPTPMWPGFDLAAKIAASSSTTKKAAVYRSNSVSSDEDVPLSMRFMHKPLRANEELEKASDPTRRNSLINAQHDIIVDDINIGGLSMKCVEDSNGSDWETDNLNMGDSPAQPYRLLRKKSGEIVKPLLKELKNRLRSLPTTPTYKQVHFGGDTDVRYFKQKDRPAAISALNLPTLRGQNDSELPLYDSDDSFADSVSDYFDDELNLRADKKITRYPAPSHARLIDWELELLNFPALLYHEKINVCQLPVFVERVFISIDKKYLLGQVAVENLAYEKSVTVRYSLDHWATIVEIPTIYVPDAPSVLRLHGYDRFIFKIPVDLLFNAFHIESDPDHDATVQERVYSLCVRYTVPGHEYWDNNGRQNYVLKLRKIVKNPDNRKVQTPKTSTQTKTGPVPFTAKSKPEAHKRKPKYLLLYLKRIVSEPTFASAQPLPQEPRKDGPNDFVKNNYYISSPLLSNLNNKEDEFLYALGSPPRGLESSMSPDFLSPEPLEESIPSVLDAKSYKELLDQYCFFTTQGDDNSHTTLVMSDNAEMCGKKGDENPYTVSSFLRH